MKNFYIAIQTRENGLYYAYCIKVSESQNIYTHLAAIPHIISANIYPTKKAAYAAVDNWNATFKMLGNSLLDTMPDGSPAPF